MLKIAVLFAIAAVAITWAAPEMLGKLQAPSQAAVAAKSAPAAPVAQPVATEATPADRHGERSIAADRGGQYSLDALIDGQSVHMLVDTGATMVVISARVADRLGLSAEAGKKWRVQTANGEALATETVLPSVDLGTVYMKNVPALIADRRSGEVNLLGASFLKRLASVEQRNGVMVLRQ